MQTMNQHGYLTVRRRFLPTWLYFPRVSADPCLYADTLDLLADRLMTQSVPLAYRIAAEAMSADMDTNDFLDSLIGGADDTDARENATRIVISPSPACAADSAENEVHLHVSKPQESNATTVPFAVSGPLDTPRLNGALTGSAGDTPEAWFTLRPFCHYLAADRSAEFGVTGWSLEHLSAAPKAVS